MFFKIGFFICLLLLNAAPRAAEKTDCEKMESQWQRLARKLDSRAGFDEFREFYLRNSPDMLEEWRKKNLQQEKMGILFLENLAREFVYLRRVQLTKPKEYRERLQVLKDEAEIRRLGRRISDLKLKSRGKENAEIISSLVAELKKKLRRSFEDSQHRQQLELMRLETEVQYLRKMVEARTENKDFILQQRLEILCGERQ